MLRSPHFDGSTFPVMQLSTFFPRKHFEFVFGAQLGSCRQPQNPHAIFEPEDDMPIAPGGRGILDEPSQQPHRQTPLGAAGPALHEPPPRYSEAWGRQPDVDVSGLLTVQWAGPDELGRIYAAGPKFGGAVGGDASRVARCARAAAVSALPALNSEQGLVAPARVARTVVSMPAAPPSWAVHRKKFQACGAQDVASSPLDSFRHVYKKSYKIEIQMVGAGGGEPARGSVAARPRPEASGPPVFHAAPRPDGHKDAKVLPCQVIIEKANKLPASTSPALQKHTGTTSTTRDADGRINEIDLDSVDAAETRQRPEVSVPPSPGLERPQRAAAGNVTTDVGVLQEYTTMAVRNLPLLTTQASLLREIDRSGFGGQYDYAYLPRHFDTGRGKGHAFINFMSASVASFFRTTWDQTRRFGIDEGAVALSVVPASVQGLQANLAGWTPAKLNRVKNPSHVPFILGVTWPTSASPGIGGDRGLGSAGGNADWAAGNDQNGASSWLVTPST